MIQSLARRYDNTEWKNVEGHITKFMPFISQYLLSDGSSVSRVYDENLTAKVQFKDDGIKVRAINSREDNANRRNRHSRQSNQGTKI